ncbi:hypothetical protein [Solicola sp. PLA-1-18]|uniref:hypothetical protein n=1 Tax=Solicola sp. PLA-1-18 TaxID=3380532 RepID=UPI003B7F0DCC
MTLDDLRGTRQVTFSSGGWGVTATDPLPTRYDLKELPDGYSLRAPGRTEVAQFHRTDFEQPFGDHWSVWTPDHVHLGDVQRAGPRDTFALFSPAGEPMAWCGPQASLEQLRTPLPDAEGTVGTAVWSLLRLELRVDFTPGYQGSTYDDLTIADPQLTALSTATRKRKHFGLGNDYNVDLSELPDFVDKALVLAVIAYESR